MSRRIALAAGMALLLAVGGCTTSRKLTTRGELADLSARHQPITVYAHGERVYELSRHVLADSVIHGLGTLRRQGRTVPFEGTIPISEIIAVKTDSRSLIKGLAVLEITALFVSFLSDGTGASPGLTLTEEVVFNAGTSCPYLYAWDGRRYELQAEPFGTAWGRALELTTLHLLPAARPEHGVVRLRLTDERRETHYVNSIQLRAIDLGSAPAAVLDGEGRAWPLSHPAAPLGGRDAAGHDIRTDIGRADGHMWECDPASLTAGSGYEDVLEVSFARPRRDSTGTLVLTGINTELMSAVYGDLGRLVGDQAALLAHAVETDPEMIAELRAYLRDAALAVSVWDGRQWEPAGAFPPEASAVTFTRALRLRIPDGAGDTVRVRLRSMADVWKVDALAADWGDFQPLPMTPMHMLSALGPEGEDMQDVIGADDGRYAVLLPPDRIELTFSAARPRPGARVAYAVAGRGYLLEWDPHVADGGSTALAAHVPGEQRIEWLKALFKHRELALQPVYEAWRKTRER